MKTYIEVSIVSRYEDQGDFINALRGFGSGVDSWEYMEEQSSERNATGSAPDIGQIDKSKAPAQKNRGFLIQLSINHPILTQISPPPSP